MYKIKQQPPRFSDGSQRTDRLVSKDLGDNEIPMLVKAWLRYQATKDQADWWATDRVMELRGHLDGLWRIVLAICAEVDDDNDVIYDIGAGPLESMISQFGDAAMDLIEPALAGNPTLLKSLAGVWGWKSPTRPRVDRVLAEYGQEPLE